MQAVRLPETLRAKLGRDQRSGAIVVDVAPGGPADRGGLLIGDVIVALGTQPIEDSDDVQRALGSDSVGSDDGTCTCCAAAKLRELAITIGERPQR
jgi:serine protease Do